MEDVLIASVLSDKVGKTAKLRKYDRSPEFTSPVNFFLNHVQKELTQSFDLYWVDGGLPEIFCILGFERIPIVYNTRYIELVYLMRRLMHDGPLSSFRERIADHVCLRVMAELAVRYSQPDWAIRAFLKSAIGDDLKILDIPGAALLDLEVQPKDEPYMAIWFFGLAHELGHLFAAEGMAFVDNPYFTPNATREALDLCLDGFQHLPVRKDEVIERAASTDNYVLSISRLRLEAFADFFAIHQLFNTTQLIMAKVETKTFDIVQFASEATLALALIGLLDNCKRVALAANSLETTQSRGEELLLLPVTYAVRQLMVRPLLDLCVARYLFNTPEPTVEQMRKTEHIMNQIADDWQRPLDQVEKGLARAMRFALFPQEQAGNLMRQFAVQVSNNPSGVDTIEANRFCDLVESFHGKNQGVEALRRITNRQA